MAAPSLTTKLYVPRARAESVSRPRLTERLNEGVTRKQSFSQTAGVSVRHSEHEL